MIFLESNFTKMVLRRLCFGWLFWVLSCGAALAQRDNIRFEKMGGEEIPQTSVRSICQDKYGLMWWGTKGGLVRFDGLRSEVYDVKDGLGSNIVNVVCADPDGNILVGTNEGFAKYDRSRELFFSVQLPVGKKISCMVPIGPNLVWVGTESGLYLGNTETMQVEDLIDNINVTALALDRDGQLWIATRQSVIVLAKQSQSLQKTSFPDLDLASRYACLYAQGETGFIYAGTNAGDLLVLNANNGLDCFHLGFSGINSISFAPDSSLWVGMESEGLVIVTNDTMLRIEGTETEAGKLIDHEVASIFHSEDGSMWVGTENQGLFQYNARRVIFKSFVNDKNGEGKFAGNLVWSLCRRDEESLWIGTDHNGMYYFNQLDDRFYPAKLSSLSNETVLSILKDKIGTVWVGTASGGLHSCIDCSDHGDFEHTSLKLDYPIFSLRESPDGRYLYVGSGGGGLLVLEKSGTALRMIAHYGSQKAGIRRLPEDEVNALHVDVHGKYLWVGTYHGHLMRLNIDNFAVEEVKTAATFGGGDPINCFFQDSTDARHLWIGTHSKGIKRYDTEGDSLDLTLTEDDGLMDAGVYGIVQDEFGSLWISTNRGLSQYNPKEGSFRNFGPESGIAGREFNGGAYLEAGADGLLYFGGIDGLTEVDPSAVSGGVAFQPRLLLTDIEIGGEMAEVGMPLHNSGVVLNGPLLGRDTLTPIELHYRDQTMLVRFAAMDYANPKDARYRWRLMRGEDTLARVEDGSGEALIVGYGYGSFRLEVEAANSHGQFDGAKQSRAVLLIDVPPPFWYHWYFWVGISLAGAVIVYFIVLGIVRNNNERYLRKKQAELLQQKKELQLEFDWQKQRLESNNYELVAVNLRLNDVLHDYEHASSDKDLAITEKDKAIQEKDEALKAREQMIQLLNEANENEKSLNKSRQVALKDKEMALLDMVRLIEIGKITTSHLKLDALVEELFPAMQKSYNFDVLALGLHEPKEDRLTYLYVHKYFGTDMEVKEPRAVGMGDISSFGIRAIRERKQIYSGVVHNEKQAVFERDLLYGKSISTIVCEPLIFRDRTLGVIVGLKTGKHALSERQTHLLTSIAAIASAGVQNCISYEHIRTLKSSKLRESQSFGHDVKHLFNDLKRNWVKPVEALFDVEIVEDGFDDHQKFGRLTIPRSHQLLIQNAGFIPFAAFVDTLASLVFVWTGRYTHDLILFEGRPPENLREAFLSGWQFAKEVMCNTALGNIPVSTATKAMKVHDLREAVLYLYPRLHFVGEVEGHGFFDLALPPAHFERIMRLIATLSLNTMKHCCPGSTEVRIQFNYDQPSRCIIVQITNEMWPLGRRRDPIDEVMAMILRARPELESRIGSELLEMAVRQLYSVKEGFRRLANLSNTDHRGSDKWSTPEILEDLLKSMGGLIVQFGSRSINEMELFFVEFKILWE